MNPVMPLLHRLDPEWVHDLTLGCSAVCGRFHRLLQWLERYYAFDDERLAVRMGDLHFPNPIGLAAGFDKNGVAVPVLQALGFGFIETGTVTPRPQAGNPKPRLYRLTRDQALINRMGFNNRGVQTLVDTLAKVKRRVPIGINLGKNKDTPIAQAYEDYELGLRRSWSVADYLVINISSPNTEGLRDLQRAAFLGPLFDRLLTLQEELRKQTGLSRQLWFKIAPDLEQDDLAAIAEIAISYRVDALVLTNTTLSRAGIDPVFSEQAGGLSGKPLFERSNRVLGEMHRLTKDCIPLVGVGGVFTAAQAMEKMRLGAKLVQIYTSLIFEGPGIVRRLKRELVPLMDHSDRS